MPETTQIFKQAGAALLAIGKAARIFQPLRCAGGFAKSRYDT
jgi:hypothetical protein